MRLLLSVKDASVRYQTTPVFENLSFNVHENTRIALVGKNGAGKSTLMNIISGRQEIDTGDRWQEGGLTIGYLYQTFEYDKEQTIFEYIAEQLSEDERVLNAYKVDMICEALHLDKERSMATLSGGQLRRTGLARSLVEEPDILLLDEPTNHLDLEAIQWLEDYLQQYRGTVLCVSHDRAFLANVTNRVFWLDRGGLRVSPKGFKDFQDWSDMLLDQEERELRNRKQIVAREVEWASRGVKARRKRNIRRLENVKAMREKLQADESAYRHATKEIKIKTMEDDQKGSKIIAEFHNVKKSYNKDTEDELKILDGFSFRLKRGDRLGILGKNGAGKTSFLKLLLKDMEPDMGTVKVRKEMEFSYFDQNRDALDPNKSLRRTLSPSGNDYINVMGRDRHVCSYLKDFMFDPARADDTIKQFSGGQKNRLLLAKVLANPKNCLILDEPTNDLDMETLDMLETIIDAYNGTLIVVSHDREFLDQTVTRILAFEGDAVVDTCIGGFTDYMNYKKSLENSEAKQKKAKTKKEPKAIKEPEVIVGVVKKKDNKLSYKLERELKLLPATIEKLTASSKEMTAQLSQADFYNKDPEGFMKTTEDLRRAKEKLEKSEERWLELIDMKEG